MSDATGIFDRTLAPLRRALFGDERPEPARLTRGGLERLRQQVDACLEQRGGEVSARARAAELGRLYLSLDRDGRARFLKLLATDYGVDRARLDKAMTALRQAGDEAARDEAERALRRALVPRRVRLLTQFNALPQGVKFLVDMRADLLPLVRGDAALKALDDDLKELLVSWFDIGFLDLRRITWDAPAALLEKLITYEAVHEIRSWNDLKNRLDSDRRCFAFFHPRMPDEPLIFVEVALVSGLADGVQELLDEHAPELAPADTDTAIFYSISNAQAGLAGVSFGNFLIKRVVDELRRELPRLKVFATLSPVPDFRQWLDEQLLRQPVGVWTGAEGRTIAAVAGTADPLNGFRALLDRPDWHRDDGIVEVLRPILMRACANFLLHEKRGRRTADRVEHFHLTNGARLERINWMADHSANGMRQSLGMMVNYLYRLGDIEKNHEAYTGNGRVVASTAVQRLGKF